MKDKDLEGTSKGQNNVIYIKKDLGKKKKEGFGCTDKYICQNVVYVRLRCAFYCKFYIPLEDLDSVPGSVP